MGIQSLETIWRLVLPRSSVVLCGVIDVEFLVCIVLLCGFPLRPFKEPTELAIPLLLKHPVVKVEVTVPEDVIVDSFLFTCREIQYLSYDQAEVKWHKFRDPRSPKRKGPEYGTDAIGCSG